MSHSRFLSSVEINRALSGHLQEDKTNGFQKIAASVVHCIHGGSTFIVFKKPNQIKSFI